jgi:hypothetical protein
MLHSGFWVFARAPLHADLHFVLLIIMSVIESDVQWFIARDGKQHGPLSDTEMRKLVELGHLRAADLVWRLGFPDWRTAGSVFSIAPQDFRLPQSTTSRQAEPQAPAPSAAWSAPAEPRADRTSGKSASRPETRIPEAKTPAADAATWSHPAPVSTEAKPRRSRSRHMVIAASVLALAGMGAWVSFGNGEAVLNSFKTETPAATNTAQTARATFETAAITASPAMVEIDTRFQKRLLWSTIKREFPEWYEVRVKEAARLDSEGKSETEITRHLVEALVGLRRQHAEQALAASASTHKELATAFLENLKNLAAEGPDKCYDFISKGETSASIIELIQSTDKSGHIEAQVVAIVTAIAEGRKSPVAHASPSKPDYDILAAELGRLGWTQADMQLFADSKALARAPHEQVCKMVQDWFTAHLTIQDSGTQERLLFETLRPVVAG